MSHNVSGVVDPSTRKGYPLDREDDFAGPDLDRTLWLPHHLRQWSSRAASAARYRLDGSAVRLVIEDDQPSSAPCEFVVDRFRAYRRTRH